MVIEAYLNSLKVYQYGNVGEQKLLAGQVASRQKKDISRDCSSYFCAGRLTSAISDRHQSRAASVFKDREEIEIDKVRTTPPTANPLSTSLRDRAQNAAPKTFFSEVKLPLPRPPKRTMKAYVSLIPNASFRPTPEIEDVGPAGAGDKDVEPPEVKCRL